MHSSLRRAALVVSIGAFLASGAQAIQPPYRTLPDALVADDGTRVTSPETWRRTRRPEILRMFTEQVFGRGGGRA